MIDKLLEIKSIDPEYWGKSGWIFLDSIALTYNPIYAESYRQFILQLPIVLPCKTCGKNLEKALSNPNDLDFALKSKENLIRWFINIRNEIYIDNKTPHKQKNIKETIDEIFYSHTNQVNIYWWIFFATLVVIALIYLLKIEMNKNNMF